MDLLQLINHPVKKEHADEYKSANPFPHIVLDDFLQWEILHKIEIPKHDDRFYRYANLFEMKLASDRMDILPESMSMLLMCLNSSVFIRWLEALTGIKALIPDPHWRGGGLHIIQPGGFLGVHEDFGIHPELKLYRRLNLLIYLNRNWKDEWGGNLELWTKDDEGKLKECAKSIEPVWNRAVIFSTPGAPHGHPNPLACPETRTRKSLALYYYTAEPPPTGLNDKSTQFMARPQDPVNPEIEALRAQRNKGRLASNV